MIRFYCRFYCSKEWKWWTQPKEIVHFSHSMARFCPIEREKTDAFMDSGDGSDKNQASIISRAFSTFHMHCWFMAKPFPFVVDYTHDLRMHLWRFTIIARNCTSQHACTVSLSSGQLEFVINSGRAFLALKCCCCRRHCCWCWCNCSGNDSSIRIIYTQQRSNRFSPRN